LEEEQRLQWEIEQRKIAAAQQPKPSGIMAEGPYGLKLNNELQGDNFKYQETMERLFSMGFANYDNNLAALKKHNNDHNAALNDLF